MGETTKLTDSVEIGTEAVERICRIMIRGYMFHKQGKMPKSIVFPVVGEVDGVKVVMGANDTVPAELYNKMVDKVAALEKELSKYKIKEAK